MRVIAGRFRGRTLDAPPGHTTRPITDRAKETLFNVLGHRFAQPGCLPAFAVLDVFAGTGSLGLEALSRGAETCTFVEQDRRTLRFLRQNIARLGVDAACTVLTDNAWTMRPPRCAGGFGLVFVDPPYRDATEPLTVVDLLERLAPCLAPEGVLVFRHEARAPAPPASAWRTLRCVDERILGQMRLLLLAPPHEKGSGTFSGD